MTNSVSAHRLQQTHALHQPVGSAAAPLRPAGFLCCAEGASIDFVNGLFKAASRRLAGLPCQGPSQPTVCRMVGGGGPVMDGSSDMAGKTRQPAGFQPGGEPDPTAGQLPGPRRKPALAGNCATERHCCGGGQTLTWTRITDPDEAASLLPAWFGSRMIGLRGRFGLILTTGDILRITSIGALHQSSSGTVLLDVLLDHGGIPDGIDLAWQPKHYLGTPVPGATVATVNLAHVVAAVEFLAEETVEQPGDAAVLTGDDVDVGPAQVGSLSETIERANEASDKTLSATASLRTDPAQRRTGGTLMDEDRFNLALRGFLKEVGVTSQREIEKLVREHPPEAGILRLRMALTSPDAPALNHVIEHAISLV